MDRRVVVTALLLLNSGCSVIDTHKAPPKGWPNLAIIEHHVSHAQMRERCSKYVPWYASPEACAEWVFEKDECHIWFSRDFPPSPWIVEHERMHCAGYDHPGSTNAIDAFNAYSGIITARALAKSLKSLHESKCETDMECYEECLRETPPHKHDMCDDIMGAQ